MHNERTRPHDRENQQQQKERRGDKETDHLKTPTVAVLVTCYHNGSMSPALLVDFPSNLVLLSPDLHEPLVLVEETHTPAAWVAGEGVLQERRVATAVCVVCLEGMGGNGTEGVRQRKVKTMTCQNNKQTEQAQAPQHTQRHREQA